MSMLLVDHFPFRPLGAATLCESTFPGMSGQNVMKMTGVFQNWKRKNSNGRIYPKSIWENVFKPESTFSQRLARRNVIGHIEHPADGQTLLKEASHVMTEVHIASDAEISASNGALEEGDIVGTYEVLPSEYFPSAKLLEGAIKAKLDFGGVSSRGNGTVQETYEGLIVNGDYNLDTWDVVFTPSVTRAKPSLKTEAVKSSKALKESGSLRVVPKESFKMLGTGLKLVKGRVYDASPATNQPDYEAQGKIFVRIPEHPEDGFLLSREDYEIVNGEQENFMQAGVLESNNKPTMTKQPLNESSFVLVTGLYGPGKVSEDKKKIPIQLIADHSGTNCFWESLNKQSGPKLGKFQSFKEAMEAMQSHCTESGNTFIPSILKETEDEDEPKNRLPDPPSEIHVENTSMTITPDQRLASIQTEAIALSQIPLKGLKLSERANTLQRSRQLRSELIQITEGAKHLSIFSDPIAKRLVEFEDTLDAPEAPAPEAPAPDAPPAPEAPTPLDGGDLDAEEATLILDKAIDAIRVSGDEEVAGELEVVRDQIAAASGGGDELPPEEMSDIPDYGGEGDIAQMESSKPFRKKVLEGYKALRTKYGRLASLSERLLTKHKRISESSLKGGEGKALREALTRANQSEVALRELGTRYNTEMIEMGQYIWKTQRPKLWESHGESLLKCETWASFEKLSADIMKDAPETPEVAPVAAPVTEGKEGEKKEKLTEAAPPATPPVTPTPEVKPLTEGAVGVQISMINRNRARR